MTMQVKCPNASCGKELIVQEEYAGKKGKCPACGNELTIPTSSNSEGTADRRPEEPWARRAERASEPPTVLPVSHSREVNEHSSLAAKPSEVASVNEAPPGLMTRAALGVGICCLVLLSFAPRMEWIFISTNLKPPSVMPVAGEIGRRDWPSWERLFADTFLDARTASADFLYCSLAVAMLATIALMLTTTAQRDLTDGAIAASGSAAVGWGTMAGIWQLGIVWKVFVLASFTHEQQVFYGNKNAEMSIWPGPGLALGLLATLILVAVFGSLVASRKRFLWLLTGAAMGVALGFLLLVLHVKPLQDLGQ